MRRAVFRVTHEMFVEAFHLPEDTKIIRCQQNALDEDICFLIEQQELPDDVGPARNSGQRYRTAMPNLEKVYAKPEEIKFVGWNV